MKKPIANPLGSPRAEADAPMLAHAFVPTPTYLALTRTKAYNFVVGRRGTGKSALYRKVRESYAGSKSALIVEVTPKEHETAHFRSLLEKYSDDYGKLRVASRMAWMLSLLVGVGLQVRIHYKAKSSPAGDFLARYFQGHREFANESIVQRAVTLLSEVKSLDVLAVPSALAKMYQLDELMNAVHQALAQAGLTAVILCDNLDEGWTPEVVPMAIIGGLAKTISDFVESTLPVYPVIFVRDNMFRALAELDTDFTRNIEGSTTRLKWDENALLQLVAQRLRVSFGLEVESEEKVWNRFAHRDLQGRSGFRQILRHTLFRPRDVISLLNEAYQEANRANREGLIEDDVDRSAGYISQNRFNDLLKEYDQVFPGLKTFVVAFSGGQATYSVPEVLGVLSEVLAKPVEDGRTRVLFSLLDTPHDACFALYSIGLIGLSDQLKGAYTFCHDGSISSPQKITDDMFVTVHPCYWRALSIVPPGNADEIIVDVNDEAEEQASSAPTDFRARRIGRVAGELQGLPVGTAGASHFEKWVAQAVAIVFQGRLDNPDLKPNPGATQQRDVVATNIAERGFWKRIYDDYRARQVIFECKNYADITSDDFRQVLSYTTGEYGKFALIVTRFDGEGFSDNERNWMRELYFKHESRVVMPLPAHMLARCIRKLTGKKEADYAEQMLSKRMDYLIRRALEIPAERKWKKGPSPRPKKKKRR